MKRNIFLIAILFSILNLNLFSSNTLFAQSKDVWLAKVIVDGSPAIIDIDGNYVVRPGIYEKINFDDFSEGMCPVTREGKEGYIDIYGNEVVPCQWKYVTKFENGFGRVNIQSMEDNRPLCGLVDRTGRLVVPPKYSYVERVRNSDLIRTEGPSCLYNSDGDLLIENLGYIQRSSSEGKLIVRGNGGEYFVDNKGSKCSKRFSDASQYQGGFASVSLYNGNKEPIYAYLDSEGNILRLDEYKWLGSFYNDGYAVVSRGLPQQQGVINSQFEEVIPCEYNQISSILDNHQKSKVLFIEGLAKVQKNGVCALINPKNEIVVPFGKYYDFHMLNGNVLKATTFNKYEHKDSFGKITTGNMHVLIDKKGNQISDHEYEFIFNFYKDYAVVYNNGMYGIIDSQGKEVIPCKYQFDDIKSDVIKEFVDYGVVRIKKKGRWGLLNRKGELIDFDYDKMSAFEDGLSLVNRGIFWFAINPSGEVEIILGIISPTQSNFTGGRLGIKKEIDGKKKYGYIDPKGEVVIPCKFDKVYGFKNVGFD